MVNMNRSAFLSLMTLSGIASAMATTVFEGDREQATRTVTQPSRLAAMAGTLRAGHECEYSATRGDAVIRTLTADS